MSWDGWQRRSLALLNGQGTEPRFSVLLLFADSGACGFVSGLEGKKLTNTYRGEYLLNIIFLIIAASLKRFIRKGRIRLNTGNARP